MQKPQVWSISKARDATAWQRHAERRATMEMGHNCGFGNKAYSWTSIIEAIFEPTF
jgi:hypothetical protein